jgi:hypothetical protein
MSKKYAVQYTVSKRAKLPLPPWATAAQKKRARSMRGKTKKTFFSTLKAANNEARGLKRDPYFTRVKVVKPIKKRR